MYKKPSKDYTNKKQIELVDYSFLELYVKPIPTRQYKVKGKITKIEKGKPSKINSSELENILEE